jgi:hypothetical protein
MLGARRFPTLGARAIAEDFALGNRDQFAHGADMQREDFIAHGGMMAGDELRDREDC